MGKTKKNSNYQTPKKEAARLLLEAEEKRTKRKKIILAIGIPVVAIALIVTIILSIVLGWFKPKENEVTYIATIIFGEYEGVEDEDGKPINAVVEIELYGNAAPITVANFVKLCNEKYYDGTYFHRYVKNFVLQGGDGDGTVDGNTNGVDAIKGEFSANGVENNIKHERGTISMARTPYDMNSASSQFFIVLETSESNTKSLDGNYAAFGKVRSGMKYIDMMCANCPVSDLIPDYQAPRILSLFVETPEEYAKRTADV
ncbi:MAG: peptidylprolyl isomerase [Clostridia bacterium]|nr:peptidylprolyl isomerase [Clostridia bacterium]